MRRALILLAFAAVAWAQPIPPALKQACTGSVTTNCTPQVNGSGTYVPPVSAGSGTVTSVATNNGLTGGTITTTGTLGLASVANNAALCNNSGGSAVPTSANCTVTGTGNLVLGTSPTLTTPALGTPSALVLTNATGLPWNAITNPTGNQALTMAHKTSTWTFDATTGAATNLITITDTASNTGTGALLRETTASGSAAYPWQADANGVGWEVDATGQLIGVGVANETLPGSLILSGNISSPAWTTNGIRVKNVASTFTDTTSSGTVAAAYTNVLGGNTIAASSATTYTNYYNTYIKNPAPGTNVTMTNKWALGVDSLLDAGNLSVIGVVSFSAGDFTVDISGNSISTGSSATGNGFKTSSNQVAVGWSNSNNVLANSTGLLGFSVGSDATAGFQLGLSEVNGGLLSADVGSRGNSAAGLKLAYVITSGGTKFTISGCSAGTTVGSATAGTFASGTTGACTVVITLPTAPTGWVCAASDQTTSANLISQSASSTSSCTVTGTTVTGDVISFLARGF